MKVLISAVASAFLIGAALLASAETASNLAIGLGAGTDGVSANAAYRLNDKFVLRGSANYLQYDSIDVESEDVNYEGDLNATTAGTFLDFHPLSNAWLISAGIYFGKREVDLTARRDPLTTVEIGEETFTGAAIGSIDGKLELNDAVPFLGVGYDSSFTSSGRWGVRAILGVTFNDPKVSLSANGIGAANPDLQAALRREEDGLESDNDWLKYYPVASIGATYRF
jgi:hypothetical protein